VDLYIFITGHEIHLFLLIAMLQTAYLVFILQGLVFACPQ